MKLLTSFFGKSKPVHFLMLSGIVLIYFLLFNFFLGGTATSFLLVLKKAGVLLVLFMSIGLLNFITKRNGITQNNSYAVLLFVVFLVWFPAILKSAGTICAGFFVLLATRRLFSLKSGLETKKKIFDASLWISAAVLFEESAILFLLLVFLGVFLYVANDYRNWLIPFIGVLTVFVLFLTYHLARNGGFSDLFSTFNLPTFDFSVYGKVQVLIPLSVFLAFTIWSLGNYIQHYKKETGSAKTRMLFVMGLLSISFLSVVFSTGRNPSALLFAIIPVSLIGAGFLQNGKDRLFKEILLSGMILLALILPFL